MSPTEQTSANASSPSPVGQAARAAGALLRRDWPAIVLFALGTVVMTYPLILKLGSVWIPESNNDVFIKMWDMWWFGHMLKTGQPAYHTRDMFYPVGLDLSFHSISWTVSALGWILAPIFGPLGAYKVTALVAVFTTAYAAYLLIHSLVQRRAAALVGGAIYSFAPYHIVHTRSHPDLAHLAPIPLTVLLLIEGLSGGSILVALGAALMLGVVAFTSLYALSFALLTLPPMFIYLALDKRRWKEARFWRATAAFAIASALVLTARLWPMLRDPAALTHAVGFKDSADKQADLLAFVVPPSSNPVFRPLVGDIAENFAKDKGKSKGSPPYLGLIPTALTLSALTWGKRQRSVLAWLAVGLLFGMLSLGTFLRVNGHVYEHITLPAAWLTWLPLVKGVRPHYYHLGLLLPLAVCSAYGLDRLLHAIGQRDRIKVGLMAVLALLLLFEYWNGPYPVMQFSTSPFYTQVAGEEGQFALIDLPMGYTPSKRYMYFQSIHNRPIVEGMAGRMPAGAYRYIEDNPALAAWRGAEPPLCDPDEYQGAINALLADGFRYVIVHRGFPGAQSLGPYFQAEPAYEDAEITVYRLEDLKAISLPGAAPCQ